MEKKKQLQMRLLDYYKFGRTEEQAKEKIKEVAKDCNFIGLPLGDNAEAILADMSSFHIITAFIDMGIIENLRTYTEAVKIAQKEHYDSKMTKAEFTKQYLAYLDDFTKSRSMSIQQVKNLGEAMDLMGVPLAEHLSGVTFCSYQLGRLHAIANMGIVHKIYDTKKIILGED
jgi:hypothetical protein